MSLLVPLILKEKIFISYYQIHDNIIYNWVFRVNNFVIIIDPSLNWQIGVTGRNKLRSEIRLLRQHHRQHHGFIKTQHSEVTDVSKRRSRPQILTRTNLSEITEQGVGLTRLTYSTEPPPCHCTLSATLVILQTRPTSSNHSPQRTYHNKGYG